MKIFQFLKIIFEVSKKDPQVLTQQSNLDIANAQSVPEEYVVSTEESFSLVEKQTTPEGIDVSVVNEQEPVHETIDELQEFVKEIDEEYSLSRVISDGSNIKNVGTNIVEQEQETLQETISLLDNSPYMALADSCCSLIKELDKLRTEENHELVDLVASRIKEGLISSGAEPITEDTSYDVIRHAAIGKSIVRNGTPIISTVEPGIAIADKVMIKAKVEI